MWLSDLVRQEMNKTQINKEAPKTSKSDAATNYRVSQQIRSMLPGQTVLGEIMSRNGNQVEIKLAEDMILAARLEADVDLDMGKVLSFEVKSNNGTTIAISPLFENLNTSANVVKALDMANLPLNQTSANMVESMMMEGMSIDKASLQTMYREVLALPDTEPSVLVQMKKLSIPITPENVEQFQNYKSAQHQILNGLTEITDQLPEEYANIKQAQGAEVAGKFYQDILIMLTGEEELSQPILKMPPDVVLESGDAVNFMGESVDLPDEPILQNPQKADITANPAPEPANTTVAADVVETQVTNTKILLDAFDFKGTEWKKFEGSLMELGVPEETINEFKTGNLSYKDLLTQIHEQLDGQDFPKKEAVFENKEFAKLLQLEFKNQMLLTPDEVSEKDNVTKLYEKMNEQLSKLQEILESVGSSDSKMAKSTTQLKNNVDFMNQLNQFATYVQLPLKMLSGEAHGDLYVYTNKRNLAKEDGNVSALLHLDMQNLGPVDVYVAMQGQKVNTQFYLKDDEMLDFIYSNIHILNERLEKRGYNLKCEFQVKEGTKNVIQEMLEQNKNVSSLTKYSFDVRA